VVVTPRALIAALLVAPALLLPAVPAEAAKRRAPLWFYGVNWDGAATATAQDVQDRQWSLMARSGVESVRTVFSWERAQPREGSTFSFAQTDPIVARTAGRRMRVLPVVLDVPVWARAFDHLASPPRDANDYAAYLRALIRRYGPRGTFWTERPDLPKRPIREYQIFNEPHLRYRWFTSRRSRLRWPRGYARLLRTAHRAIKREDRRARVVLAGLTNDSWNKLRTLYRLRARRYFDVAAIQTYTSSPRSELRAIRLFRRVMRRYRDGRAPLWATELSWPAARGRMRVPAGLRSVVTSDRVMASRLRRTYAALVALRRNPRYRVARVFWYTWSSPYRAQSDIFDFAGLQSFSGGRFRARPALRAFRSSARRFQGCRKNGSGACVRR
jgi:hypothetical protein